MIPSGSGDLIFLGLEIVFVSSVRVMGELRVSSCEEDRDGICNLSRKWFIFI